MLRFKTILHPTDFSAAAEYAFQVACSLARDHQAHLIVMHSVPPAAADYGGLPPHEVPEGYNKKVWEDIRHMTEKDPHIRDIYIKSELVDGDPVHMILARAEELGCDLIVMGTHGRTGLGRLLMGSVAEAVMRRAACPVLTVKSPPPEAAAVGAEAEAVAQA